MHFVRIIIKKIHQKTNKKEPAPAPTGTGQISEEILNSQIYCIIFGGSTQAERLCVVFFVPIFKKGR